MAEKQTSFGNLSTRARNVLVDLAKNALAAEGKENWGN